MIVMLYSEKKLGVGGRFKTNEMEGRMNDGFETMKVSEYNELW